MVVLGKLGGSDVEVLAILELLELILPVVCADFRLVERYDYRFGLLLFCLVMVYVGVDDRISLFDLMLVWSSIMIGGYVVWIFFGGYFYL